MPANREPLHEASDSHSYYYRRSLGTRDFVLATAVGIGAGLIGFYLATRFAQRTPLLDASKAGALPRKRRMKDLEG